MNVHGAKNIFRGLKGTILRDLNEAQGDEGTGAWEDG